MREPTKEMLRGLAIVGGFAFFIGTIAAGYVWLMLTVAGLQ